MKLPQGGSYLRRETIHNEGNMEFHAFYILITSMILNFIVLGISLNRPDSFFPVSLSAISISLQGYALRLIAIDSIS